MEFTLDLALIRRIANAEVTQARAEIAELGVLSAYRLSLQRHDERLAQADDADQLACQSGCSWCCHFSVDVRPVEVFNLLDAMQALPPLEQQRLQAAFAANSQVLGELDEVQRMQQNLACPFLVVGRCSVYAARPQTCRNYHATNAAGCQQSFEQPDNFDIAPEYAPLVYQSGGAQVEAFTRAMDQAGYDTTAYELNSALHVAWPQVAQARQRFLDRQPCLAPLQGEPVGFELTDPD